MYMRAKASVLGLVLPKPTWRTRQARKFFREKALEVLAASLPCAHEIVWEHCWTSDVCSHACCRLGFLGPVLVSVFRYLLKEWTVWRRPDTPFVILRYCFALARRSVNHIFRNS